MPRVTIHNDRPRLDTAGKILDCHDGCLHHFDGTFYLYGTSYGATDGFSPANTPVVYSSPDLTAWTPHGPLLKGRPEGVYYRPYLLRDARRGRYVLWFNWYPKLWEGQYGVAVSDSPAGPFTILKPEVHLARPKGGDYGLALDDAGHGFIIYTSIADGHAVRVERLADDLTAGTGETSDILATGCEAPTLFSYGGLWHALLDSNCCFCPAGSGARHFTAPSPFGPWTLRGNINRTPDGRPIIPAQQTHVARLPTTAGPALLWMGDRWHSRPDGIKGHDFQYWSPPLTVSPDGAITPLTWTDRFDLEL